MVLALAALAGGCGGSSRAGSPLSKWLSSNTATRTVTLTLHPGATDVFSGYNYNGYGRGAVLVAVPLGWRVTVRCINDVASISHSCAIVRDGGNATAPSFPGASSPHPQTGLRPGSSAQFSFSASRAGAYRIACLVPGHETMGMWDGFEIGSTRRPWIKQVRFYGAG